VLLRQASSSRRQIEELYYAALDIAAAERAALLDRADSELRRNPCSYRRVKRSTRHQILK
jgi:hypothetical protein